MGRFDSLLTAEGQRTLASLNPGFGPSGRLAGNNCPATAAALDRYLRTGEVRPATSIMAGQGFIQTDGGVFRPGTRHGIIAMIDGRLLDGEFRVVTGERRDGSGHHEFVLVNINGLVYYADAQPRPPLVVRAVAGAQDPMARFEVFTWYSGPGYTVRRT